MAQALSREICSIEGKLIRRSYLWRPGRLTLVRFRASTRENGLSSALNLGQRDFVLSARPSMRQKVRIS